MSTSLKRQATVRRYQEKNKIKNKKKILQIITKICSQCKISKLSYNFPKDLRSPTGFRSSCKSCYNNSKRKNYKDDPKIKINYNKQRNKLRKRNRIFVKIKMYRLWGHKMASVRF